METVLNDGKIAVTSSSAERYVSIYCFYSIDDFYEAAELFISTQDPTTLDENGEIDAFSASTNDVAWVQETTMKLQLLRGWKKFSTNSNDIELLLMGMEEVLGMVTAFKNSIHICSM